MASRSASWGVVAVAAGAFIWWQYANYAHNNKLNHDLGMPEGAGVSYQRAVDARAAAAGELIDKKQLGDVLPTTPEYVHYRVIDGLYALVKDSAHPDRQSDALKQLTGLMKDSDVGVRAKAQRFLVKLGPQAIGVDKAKDDGLINALKDGDAHAKKGAVAVLDTIGRQGPSAQKAVIDALVGAVKGDKDERPAAIDALVGLAPAPNTPMLKLLSDKDAAVRSAAANYFGNAHQTVAEPSLRKLLTDKDTRPAAMRAEGLLGDMAALPEMERALTAPADAGNRRVAIVAIGDLRAVSAAPQLTPFLKDNDPDIRAVAVVALRSMGPAALPEMEQQFNNPDPQIRRGIADSMTFPEAIPLLTRALRDPDPNVRASAATSLGATSASVAVAPLITALHDPSPDVATSAVASLESIGAPAVDPLVQAMQGAGAASPAGAQNNPKSGAQNGLPAAPGTASSESSPGSQAATPDMANARSEVVASYASDALARIGRPAARAVIAAAESGPLPGRKWAIITMHELRTPETQAALQQIARNGDPSLRWYAQDALRRYQA